MPNIKSQIKRIEIGERNNAHHSARKSETRTQVKKAELAIAAKNKEAAVASPTNFVAFPIYSSSKSYNKYLFFSSNSISYKLFS